MEQKQLKSSVKEKICYGMGDVGGNMIWSFCGGFITLYYTDSVAISAAYVGTMMLICRLFDGISDLIAGSLIDMTRSKLGKARSWLFYSIIPLILIFWATFHVPADFSEVGKKIYMFVTYFFLTVIAFTAMNLAYHAMLPRFSLTSDDRAITSVVRTIFATVTILALNIATPLLLASLGGENDPNAWSTIVNIYAVIALLGLFITFFGVKEKIASDVSTEEKKGEKPNLKEALKVLLSSRYFYIAIALFIVYYTSTGMTGIGVYYARDVLGDASLYSLISMVSMLPTIFAMPLAPKLFKKFGKRNAMRGGLALTVICALIRLIDIHNVPLYMITMAIGGVGNMPIAVSVFTLAGDIVDYNDMKTGIRAEGIATAANTCGSKLGSGLGAAILGWALALGHYDGTLAAQPDSAIMAMVFVAVIIPAVLNLIGIILLSFWDLEEYSDQIQAYLMQKTNKDTVS